MLEYKQRRKASERTSKKSKKKGSLGDKCRFGFGIRRSIELNYE